MSPELMSRLLHPTICECYDDWWKEEGTLATHTVHAGDVESLGLVVVDWMSGQRIGQMNNG